MQNFFLNHLRVFLIKKIEGFNPYIFEKNSDDNFIQIILDFEKKIKYLIPDVVLSNLFIMMIKINLRIFQNCVQFKPKEIEGKKIIHSGVPHFVFYLFVNLPLIFFPFIYINKTTHYAEERDDDKIIFKNKESCLSNLMFFVDLVELNSHKSNSSHYIYGSKNIIVKLKNLRFMEKISSENAQKEHLF
ncbi:hypothetical protein BpHYR1_046142 [Brachionus plicatilis]|uniref:Uncharacterized protein n=1 Tax=Brachionus plicatilis TaxID=10195 RepID=A0A3M7QPR7_BRAPC|nr:hypothetical protein BpHYR1_046142 [Brachionus plicatilis]